MGAVAQMTAYASVAIEHPKLLLIPSITNAVSFGYDVGDEMGEESDETDKKK